MREILRTSVRCQITNHRVMFLGEAEKGGYRFMSPRLGKWELVIARVFDRKNTDRAWTYKSGKFL